MLDAARDRMHPGDRVLLIVPESGRFTMAFAQLTCVGPDGGPSRAELAASPLGEPSPGDSPAVTRVFGELAEVWAELQRTLARVPVVRRIEDGSATLEDYRRLLLNLRQQVVDGGRWISLAAANFSVELFWLRSAAISHAADEHRDYQLLERDYAAVGGDPGLMATTQRERRLIGAVRVRLPPGRPARSRRPARRDVRHRRPRRTERGRLGELPCRAALACATTSSAS